MLAGNVSSHSIGLMALVPGKISHPKIECRGYVIPPEELGIEDAPHRPEDEWR